MAERLLDAFAAAATLHPVYRELLKLAVIMILVRLINHGRYVFHAAAHADSRSIGWIKRGRNM